MARRVLVQFHNITPLKDFGIRILAPRPESVDREPEQPAVQLNLESGGCRTDLLRWELSRAGLRLSDVHLKYRDPEGRKVPVLNYTYSDDRDAFRPALSPFKEWREAHPPNHPRFKEASLQEKEAYLQRQYQRSYESLQRRFEVWTNDLFCCSWCAGRAFVHPDLICINLVRPLRLDGNDAPFSISRFLASKPEAGVAEGEGLPYVVVVEDL